MFIQQGRRWEMRKDKNFEGGRKENDANSGEALSHAAVCLCS